MIKLSRLADYAVVVLTEMAGAGADARLSSSALAAQTKLPEPTVAKILKNLTRGGILESVRGVNGGYMLARPAAQISVADIVAAMDGPVSLTDCASDKNCILQEQCILHGRWGKLNMAVRTALEGVSLNDLLPVQPAEQNIVTGG